MSPDEDPDEMAAGGPSNNGGLRNRKAQRSEDATGTERWHAGLRQQQQKISNEG